MRVDGALHPVAHLDRDRYRVIMGELASRAGISSAAAESQSGHMQREITRGGSTHLLNLRVETVPTKYGQDAVMRLFNFDESLLNLDLLGIPDKQRKEIDEIISHPRGLVLMVGPTAVSYTHLDVYKRQMHNWRFLMLVSEVHGSTCASKTGSL